MRSRFCVIGLVVAVLFLSATQEASAWRRRRRVAPAAVAATVVINTSWQKIAQMRANAMARRGNLTHNIHRIADCPSYPDGLAEGIGYGSSPQCATCTFRGRTVVADAHAKSANGLFYRVRFWK